MKGRGLAWLAALPLAALLLLLVAPLLRLVLEGWGSAGQAAPSIWAMWQDDYLRWRVGWSVLQAAATCVAALALGTIETASKYLASDWGSLFFFLSMALFLAWRPQGLLVARRS